MTATAVHPPTRRVAVFGSVSAERPPAPDRDETFSPAARAVLELVIEAIASSAPAIVTPILDRAVAAGTITRAERHAMLVELSDPEAADQHLPPVSEDARRTLREALAAIRRAAPGIARPILDEAVDAERLTPAQELRILERLRSSPSRLLRGTRRPRLAEPAPSA
jgi:hypothetical protein